GQSDDRCGLRVRLAGTEPDDPRRFARRAWIGGAIRAFVGRQVVPVAQVVCGTCMTEEARRAWPEEHFGRLFGFAVAIAALIRFRYVLTDRRQRILGDGIDYHLSAL